ncbi:hypothetical protein [Ottowia sp.]|uniref:hypothetical protein n=1 Tax=Ottowia sp. TaxID=1898956 RepID=UPI0025F5F543|nr:hypothetical protein [Ottowia sp.]MBK6616150.1 hypothetical protein [Ottowia sp.]
MASYFVACFDAGVNSMEAAVIAASSEAEAIAKYLTHVLAFSAFHREDVLDRSINLSFAERFFITSTQEKTRFREEAKSGTEKEIVISRMRAFFADSPILGDRYVAYFDSGNEELINDEVLVFIAQKKPQEEHGLVAILLDDLPHVQ